MELESVLYLSLSRNSLENSSHSWSFTWCKTACWRARDEDNNTLLSKYFTPLRCFDGYQRTQCCEPFGALASCPGNWGVEGREKSRTIPTITGISYNLRLDGSFAPKDDFTNLYFCLVGTETWGKLWVLRLLPCGKASVSFNSFKFVEMYIPSLRKQPTISRRRYWRSLPAKWRLCNKRGNFILMTRHHPDLVSASVI